MEKGERHHEEHLERADLITNDDQEIADGWKWLEEQHQMDSDEETDEKFFRRVRRETEHTSELRNSLQMMGLVVVMLPLFPLFLFLEDVLWSLRSLSIF